MNRTKQPTLLDFPVYIGSNGQLYDLFYKETDSSFKLPEKKNQTKLKNNFTRLKQSTTENDEELSEQQTNESENEDIDSKLSLEELLDKYAPRNLNKLQPFPSKDNYKSFDDFEQAVIEWKTNCEKLLGFLSLPEVMSQTYSRPFYSKSNSETSETDSRKSSTSIGDSVDLGRSSYDRGSVGSRSSIGDLSALKNDSFIGNNKRLFNNIDERTFSQLSLKGAPEIMEGTDLMMIKKNNWDNQFVPIEPEPSFYETIEDYEKAYLNWYDVVNNNLMIIPPHSSEFSSRFDIQTSTQREKIEEEKRAQEQSRLFREKIKKKKQKAIIRTNNHYKWKKRVDQKNISGVGNYGMNALDDLMLQVYNKPYKLLRLERLRKEERKKQLQEFNVQKKQEKEEGMNLFLNLQSMGHKEMNDLKKKLENPNLKVQNNDNNNNSNLNTTSINTNSTNNTAINNINQNKQKESQLVGKVIDMMQKAINTNMEYYQSPLPLLLGIIHGVMPEKIKIQSGLNKNKFTTQKTMYKGVIKTNLSNMHIRRSDLTGPMIKKSFDCPSLINSNEIEFNVPNYQHSEPIDLKTIKDPNNIEKLKNKLLVIQQSNFLHQVDSKQHPKIYFSNKIDQDKQFVVNIIEKSKPFTITQLKKILRYGMFFDCFRNLLSDYIVYNNKEETFLKIFSDCLTTENFYEILDLYKSSSSFVVHANVSCFIMELVSLNIWIQVLEKYVREKDLDKIYYIARSINFLSEIPQIIFPYKSEVSLMAKSMINCDSTLIENGVFSHYYISTILNTLFKGENNYLYVGVSSSVQKIRDGINNIFAMTCESNPAFLEKEVYKAITCRSSTISGYYLFILIYLLKVEDKLLAQILRSKKTDLLGHLKEMSQSRFDHVKMACLRLLEVLKQDQKWADQIYHELTSDFSLLIQELTPPPLPEDPNQPEDRSAPFLVDLYNNFFTFVFNKYEKDTKVFLPSPIIFFELVQHLENLVKQNFTNYTLEMIANILLSFVKAFSKLKAIDYGSESDNKIKNLTGRQPRLFVDFTLLKRITEMIKSTPQSLDSMNEKLISIISYILRFDNVFTPLKTQETLWNDLHAITRDSKTDILSSKSWKLFEEIVYYHPKMIEYFQQINLLQNQMNLLGSRKINVLTHGLQTLANIFGMYERESKNLEKGIASDRPNLKDSLRSFEKEVKLFVVFFNEKALFVKLNMIYKNHGTKGSGLIFVHLAKVFFQIIYNPLCKKIYSNNMKKTEYKGGLDFFKNYFTGFESGKKKGKKKPSTYGKSNWFGRKKN
ncbi:sca1 complex scaffold protein scaa [Anaeramoeba flamelloides]|uniref:Sca1 complex scaffold protein scaa n=1 Tax=Anaeramoeba flamelloides TaxID=1746091 RepID=A0ABQ8XNK2_9EUKA|nr:sca1 complex scaffold protein scaa [Anaeramoeba flamelloides]